MMISVGHDNECITALPCVICTKVQHVVYVVCVAVTESKEDLQFI